jgi:hypothetical protein
MICALESNQFVYQNGKLILGYKAWKLLSGTANCKTYARKKN